VIAQALTKEPISATVAEDDDDDKTSRRSYYGNKYLEGDGRIVNFKLCVVV